MKEVTRIFTVEITTIAEVKSEDELVEKEISAEMVKHDIKRLLGTTDAVVTNVQDFIRDIK